MIVKAQISGSSTEYKINIGRRELLQALLLTTAASPLAGLKYSAAEVHNDSHDLSLYYNILVSKLSSSHRGQTDRPPDCTRRTRIPSPASVAPVAPLSLLAQEERRERSACVRCCERAATRCVQQRGVSCVGRIWRRSQSLPTTSTSSPVPVLSACRGLQTLP
jgi:hypothetical protein